MKEAKLSLASDKSPETVHLVQRAQAMSFGKNVKKSRVSGELRKELGISKTSASKYAKIRKTGAWKMLQRKTRKDAISDDVKQKVYDHWTSASHPTGNKNDITRIRLGRKVYEEHPKQILERRQTDVYNDFCELNPDIRMHQRTFEKLKPCFVIPVRAKDRNVCCCQICITMQMAHQSLMAFRKKLKKKEGVESKIYEDVGDLISDTLCATPSRKCMERKCKDCGINKLDLLNEEHCENNTHGTVKWCKYEYRTRSTSKGKDKKRLTLVEKETSPAEFLTHFRKCVEAYTLHDYTARNQHKQFRSLMESLPLEDAIVINDYSQNYTCRYKNEIQGVYFDPEQAEIHVSIIHRHARRDVDGDESSEAKPIIITEQLFVILPGDTEINSNSVHVVREHLAKYFEAIDYELKTLHEWNDGCASQYKSRHCLLDVSYTEEDFGFSVIRNYYATSHAKGPQDAAGGCIKRYADLAVIQGKSLYRMQRS